MSNPPEETEFGKDYPVLVCQNCGHADRIEAVPADEEGRPYEEFQHQCSKCKTNQTVRLSDIQRGRAHRKH